MRQSITTTLLAVLLSMPGIKVSASIERCDISLENKDGVTIYYKWVNNRTELAVCRDIYNDASIHQTYPYWGKVFIPETVEYNGITYRVTSIYDHAFRYCSGLTSITIPNSVTSIGEFAFEDCSGLISVTIPNGVTSIGMWAFRYCSGLTSVTIPNSVTSIRSTTFSGCSGLTSIIVEEGNAKYDSRNNCNALIETESDKLLRGCKNTTIPNSVTSIGEWAFDNCSGLTYITIPNSVTSIGNYAFLDCSGLTSITIPNSVTSIVWGAFQGCSGLTSIIVEEDNTKYDSRNYCNAIIETVSNVLIAGCKNTTIPNSVTSIEVDAFHGCSGLTSVTIPYSVTSIGRDAFSGCSGLTSVTIPNGVISIGAWALSNCSGLTSVTIPNSVTSIGKMAFRNCIGLKTVISKIENPFAIDESVFSSIPSNAQLIVPPGKKSAYQNTNGWKQFTNIVEAELIGYEFESSGIRYKIGENNTVSVTSKKGRYSGDIVIPSSVVYHGKTYSVTSIGFWAFAFGDLTSVTIPNSVTSIGSRAFEECRLTSITIPNSVTSIGEWAFQGCSLASITIPNSVTSISFESFKGCSLTSVTIPSSVALIGPGAFSECYSLATVVSEMENPCEIVYDAFSYINANATLIVPPGTKSAYQSKAGWNKFGNIVEIEKKQTIHVATAGTLPDLIPDYEKYYIEDLTLTGELNGTDLAFLREMAGRSVWIWFHFENPNIFDLKSGEGLALETQGKLINLDISNATIVSGGGPSLQLQGTGFTNIYSSDNTIPAGLFHDCRLTAIKLPRNVSSIESLAFGNCPLTSIIIPNSVEIIGRSAFWGCSSLESIVVENGNTKYDSRNNCEAIIETESNTLIAGCKNTIIPSNVTSIGNEAFEDCSGLTSVTIPNSVTSIGGYAFQNCTDLTSLTIPNSVTSIDDGAFMDCKSLTSIISEIENPFVLLDGGEESPITYPFKGIPSYAQLIVPQGTKAKYQTTAGWNRFYNIVESSGKWGNNVYYYYNALTYKLTISGEGPMWNIEDYDEHPWKYLSVKMLEIEPGVTSIGDFAFTRFGMTSVTIPNSVKSIGNYSFLFCGSLASVTIPNSVSSISPGAFQGCGKLTRVVSKIENPFAIDNTVFSNISSDAKLIVPKGTIGKYKATAGWNFANIVEATGSEQGDFSDKGIYFNLKNDGSLEVIGLASWTTIADIPSSIVINGTKYRVTSIGERAFEGRSDITYLSIPYSIKTIGKYAFVDCGSSMTVNIVDPESWCQMELGNEHASPLSSAGKMLVHDIETTSFTVPETVTSIGAFTFYQCSCLESLYLPGSVKSIDSSAFEDCDYLTSLTLGEGLQSIGGSAFEGCKRLTTLTIPSTVNSMLINAFKNCSGLTSVTSEIDNPFMIDTSVFNGIPSNAQLIVPKGTKSKYQATEGWKNFTNIIEVGGLVLEGDVNGDGVVNETDAIDVATYILGKTPTGFKKDAADVNNDNKVNAADIVIINKMR